MIHLFPQGDINLKLEALTDKLAKIFRPGSVVQAQVTKSDGDRVILNLNNNFFQVKSEVPLEPGQWIKGRVTIDPAGTTYLKLIESPQELELGHKTAKFLKLHGHKLGEALSTSPLTREIVAHIIDQKGKPTPAMVRSISRFFTELTPFLTEGEGSNQQGSGGLGEHQTFKGSVVKEIVWLYLNKLPITKDSVSLASQLLQVDFSGPDMGQWFAAILSQGASTNEETINPSLPKPQDTPEQPTGTHNKGESLQQNHLIATSAHDRVSTNIWAKLLSSPIGRLFIIPDPGTQQQGMRPQGTAGESSELLSSPADQGTPANSSPQLAGTGTYNPPRVVSLTNLFKLFLSSSSPHEQPSQTEGTGNPTGESTIPELSSIEQGLMELLGFTRAWNGTQLDNHPQNILWGYFLVQFGQQYTPGEFFISRWSDQDRSPGYHKNLDSKKGINLGISISPQYLGPMVIRIHLQETVLSLEFTTHRSDTKDLLDTFLHELKNNLKDKGLTLAKLETRATNLQAKGTRHHLAKTPLNPKGSLNYLI